MQINQFEGIQQFHDGRPVTDYRNMIPLGTSVIDRLGDKVICLSFCYNRSYNKKVISTFADSAGNIYIATYDGVYYTKATIENDEVTAKQPARLLDKDNGYSPNDNWVTFCESSTKPSQVYCCDGSRVWFWNIESPNLRTGIQKDEEHEDWYEAFKPHKLPLFDWDTLPAGETKTKILSTLYESTNALSTANDSDKIEYRTGWFDTDDVTYNSNGITYKVKLKNISSITWFDNRLICVEKDKGTLWLSEVDPSKYLVPSLTDDKVGPIWPWGVDKTRDSSENQNKSEDWVYTDLFMPYYYKSTVSAANLQDAIAFAGQLFFLNDTSIEIWSSTGSADNPIQHSTQATLHFGGRSPVIVDDKLFLICRSNTHNDFIGVITQGGSIERASNDEIESRFRPTIYRLRPLIVRDQAYIVAYTDDTYDIGYALTQKGYWWKYDNLKNETNVWSISQLEGHIIGITQHGALVEATETNREYLDGKPIIREITGGFMQFISRKILRSVELICDTGIYLDTKPARHKYYLRVSFDRALNYGPYIYRAAGTSGDNNRSIIWRNCGSGNSLLLQFGTSDNLRFQIYGLNIETD